jgi:hypothetical protein
VLSRGAGISIAGAAAAISGSPSNGFASLASEKRAMQGRRERP